MGSDDLFRIAADRYGFHRSSLRFVAVGREATRRFYLFSKQGKEYILRVDKCHAGLIGQTVAEMHWMSYLAGEGVRVTAPLEARDGTLAGLAEADGETHILSAIEKAEGRLWDKDDPALWNQGIFYQWGKTMGEFHRVSKDYRPAEGQEKRPEFKNIVLETVREFPSVNMAAEEVIGEIEALPKDRDSYGLIHCDLHPDNFRIDGGRINVFDFADCAYGWYALDIGVALSVGLWLGRYNGKGEDLAEDILNYFFKGYLAANAMDDFWVARIPLFMRLCQIAGFSCSYDCYDPTDERQEEEIHNIENHIFLAGCSVKDCCAALKTAKEAREDRAPQGMGPWEGIPCACPKERSVEFAGEGHTGLPDTH